MAGLRSIQQCRLVYRQNPVGSFALIARLLQLISGAEEAAVGCHIEETLSKPYSPGVSLLPELFVNQYRDAGVNLRREFGIFAGAKDWCRVRVGIYCGDL